MELPKISVVVPIFKVEKYIHRCIKSILGQTYTNLEIILVDDGSPDQCGIIAEEFAKTDNRIKVIHKENGGLSDARNCGIQYVTGKYTVFVDSDDWLDKKMIAEMIKYGLKFKADVVQSAFYYAYEDFLLYDNRYFQKDDPPKVLGNASLMKELVINEQVKNFAWGKLYKTDLIKDIPFKKGVLFEDVFWAHQVMQKVNTYVMLHQPMCYYFQRNDSIVSNYTPRNLDIIRGLKERQIFIETNYKDLANESSKVLLKTILIHYNLLLMNRKKDHRGQYKKDLRVYVRDNYRKFKKAVGDDQELKQQLTLFQIHPYINIFFLLLKKVLRKTKIHSESPGLEKINLN